jgi:hypothetical protein
MDEPSSSIMRRRPTFHRIRPRDALTVAHVLGVLIIVELLIRRVGLPRLCEVLGFRLDLAPASRERDPLPATDLSARAQRQLRCTNLVAESWPFSEGPCLRRSLVAGRLLRDLHPALRLGVVGQGESLTGHAWLEVNERPLEDIDDYSMFYTVDAPR